MLHVAPALTGTGALATVPHVTGVVQVTVLVTPAYVIDALRTLVFAVPVLLRFTVQVLVEAMHDAVAVTWALEVNDPNRPNTNPAMAMAAMSVVRMFARKMKMMIAAKMLPSIRCFLMFSTAALIKTDWSATTWVLTSFGRIA